MVQFADGVEQCCGIAQSRESQIPWGIRGILEGISADVSRQEAVILPTEQLNPRPFGLSSFDRLKCTI